MAVLYKYFISKFELDDWTKAGFLKLGLKKAKQNALLVAQKKAESLGLDPSKVTVKDAVGGHFVCEYPDED